MIRSESTSAFGQPSETKLTVGAAWVWVFLVGMEGMGLQAFGGKIKARPGKAQLRGTL
jgi:hypothetical protein